MSEKNSMSHTFAGKHAAKVFEEKYPRVQRQMDRLRDAEYRVEMIRDKRDTLRMMTTDISAHLSGMPRSDSPDQQKILTILAEIDELEEKLVSAEEALQAIRLETASMFCRVTHPIGRKALLLYYVEHKHWWMISRTLHIGDSSIFKLRRKSLAELEALLKADEEEG